jgi:hypothetical protein
MSNHLERREDCWAVCKGQYDENPLFVRVNTSLTRSAPKLRFKASFAAPLLNPSVDGLPQGDEFAKLDQIEIMMASRMETLGAKFALVITTSGCASGFFTHQTPQLLLKP